MMTSWSEFESRVHRDLDGDLWAPRRPARSRQARSKAEDGGRAILLSREE